MRRWAVLLLLVLLHLRGGPVSQSSLFPPFSTAPSPIQSPDLDQACSSSDSPPLHRSCYPLDKRFSCSTCFLSFSFSGFLSSPGPHLFTLCFLMYDTSMLSSHPILFFWISPVLHLSLVSGSTGVLLTDIGPCHTAREKKAEGHDFGWRFSRGGFIASSDGGSFVIPFACRVGSFACCRPCHLGWFVFLFPLSFLFLIFPFIPPVYFAFVCLLACGPDGLGWTRGWADGTG